MAEGNNMNPREKEQLDILSEVIRRRGIAEITGPQPIIDIKQDEHGAQPYNQSSVPLVGNGSGAVIIIAIVAIVAVLCLLLLSPFLT